MTVTIRDIQIILTQPNLSPRVIVKVITSEPGLIGLGCASCSRQVYAVKSVIENRLKPLVVGKDVSRIEELWQLMTFNGYWRNGPVLNNAISGIDMALWDIKGKMANMPLYQLFGGKVREGAHVYVHADGPSTESVIENMYKRIEECYRYLRVQLGIYGGLGENIAKPENAPNCLEP